MIKVMQCNGMIIGVIYWNGIIRELCIRKVWLDNNASEWYDLQKYNFACCFV